MVFFTASSATDRSARCHSCQGSHVATWRYDAYGSTLATTGDPSLENYRFSTKPYDELTGFYYYGYRYYDPVTGRWPSRDSIEEITGLSPELREEGPNLYGFGPNDPLNGVDVKGLIWRWIIEKISGSTRKKPLTSVGTLGGRLYPLNYEYKESERVEAKCNCCDPETGQQFSYWVSLGQGCYYGINCTQFGLRRVSVWVRIRGGWEDDLKSTEIIARWEIVSE